MGSLMAGWSSPTKDPKVVTYQRNRSLTREEIDAYWRSKKMSEEEHLSGISSFVNNSNNNQENLYKGSGERLHRSISLPLNDTKGSFLNSGLKLDDHQNTLIPRGWWTRSNSAFLNEPPVKAMEGPSHKYAAQYHLTNLGSL